MRQLASSAKYLTKLQQVYSYYLEVADCDQKEAFNMLALHSLKTDTEKAHCSSPADEKMIRARVAEQGGFELLDKIIFQLRKRLVKNLMKIDTVCACNWS